MRVKIKKLHPDAVIPFKIYPSDLCYDVVAVSEEEIAPNIWRYGLGFALQIERDKEHIGDDIVQYDRYGESPAVVREKVIDFSESDIKLSVDFRPRSSIYKTGMSLANTPATGNENYTGEYKLVFYHLMPNMPRYKVGDKIAQCKIGVTFPIDFREVEELNKTDRDAGGFGSTGK